eukprot:2879218-Rhodomonas_salina.1
MPSVKSKPDTCFPPHYSHQRSRRLSTSQALALHRHPHPTKRLLVSRTFNTAHRHPEPRTTFQLRNPLLALVTTNGSPKTAHVLRSPSKPNPASQRRNMNGNRKEGFGGWAPRVYGSESTIWEPRVQSPGSG